MIRVDYLLNKMIENIENATLLLEEASLEKNKDLL